MKSAHVKFALVAALMLLTFVALRGRSEWPYQKYDRVVGYQFVNPLELASPFTMARGKINLAELSRFKRKEAVLTQEQTSTLLTATFNGETPEPPAACYEPHHIFIFYSGNTCVGAIEICFACSGCICWPEAHATITTSYAKLGVLCEKLGLGTEEPLDQAIFRKSDPNDPFGRSFSR